MMESQMMPQVISRYRIISQIATSNLGSVYLAEDTKLERPIALKVLPTKLATDPGALARFRQEARAIAAVNHPNIVVIHSVEEVDSTHFITMELIEGETFLEYVRPWNPTESSARLDLTRLRAALAQLVDGVRQLHIAGKWHRDRKPGNVLVTKEGRVVMLDFGISAQIQSARWFGRAAYVESSRNCNFRCSFCSLTAEGHHYLPYPVDFVRRQILAQGRTRYLMFLDNNFYGGDRSFFLERMEMLRELYDDRRFVGWGALVTNDFFENPGSISRQVGEPAAVPPHLR